MGKCGKSYAPNKAQYYSGITHCRYTPKDKNIKIDLTKFTLRSDSMIILHTNQGDIRIKLDSEKAPISSQNFIDYVKDGFYDGTIFHRVIKNFMIQGGGFDTDMSEKETRAQIKNEANNGLSNLRGTLAMARTMVPHSASSQFFINVEDNTFLDHSSETAEGWGYAVFGEVVEGMDVVDKIREASTTTRMGHQDVPADDMIIESAEVVEGE